MNTVFCANLKEIRKDCGLTQKQVALRLNVVESCYANWEQGRTEPGITDLQTLCVIFNTSADTLLGLESSDGGCGIKLPNGDRP
ncbi:MAG: helix-turn-helix domain-containing protein [Clostridiales bacterium]|jgi:repressor LexA|nr:helix-turn-helix domain-containing protein [Clostridiales bacterium]